MNISLKDRPRVLLIGNGISRACSSIMSKSWDDLIQKIYDKYNDGYYGKDGLSWIKKLPYPMQIVAASRDHVDGAMKDFAKDMDIEDLCEEDRSFLRGIICSGQDAILTTNYTYELETAVIGKYSSYQYRKARRVTQDTTTKTIQNHLFQYTDLGESIPPIWHVHGELHARSSMIMGHYYYGKLVREIQDYIPGFMRKYKKAIAEGQDSIEVKSWVDYFLLGDVHIVGFAWDISEEDIWWLVCCKKRNFDNTRIVYHVPKQSEIAGTEKEIMMKMYGVEIDCEESGFDYLSYYQRTIVYKTGTMSSDI